MHRNTTIHNRSIFHPKHPLNPIRRVLQKIGKLFNKRSLPLIFSDLYITKVKWNLDDLIKECRIRQYEGVVEIIDCKDCQYLVFNNSAPAMMWKLAYPESGSVENFNGTVEQYASGKGRII